MITQSAGFSFFVFITQINGELNRIKPRNKKKLMGFECSRVLQSLANFSKWKNQEPNW